ncbi:MAG: metallophosphoesterase [Aestuariibacter sp.]
MIQLLQINFDQLFLVGDTHGQYDLLMAALRDAGFDRNKGHILVSVGDLIDRGPDSVKMLQLLAQPWFYCVMGNHEQMLLDSLDNDSDTCVTDRWNWQKMNGGDWYNRLGEQLWEVQQLMPKIAALPLAMEITSDQGRIGVIHANVPNNHWPTAMQLNDLAIRKQVLWSREKGQLARTIADQYFSRNEAIPGSHLETSIREFPRVAGIDWVVVGHTIMPAQRPVQLGNTIFLDVGAARGLKPKVICATELVEQTYLLS